MVRIGFGSNNRTRYTLPNGFKKFVVHNIPELELLLMHNRVYCAEIGKSVSARKRQEILARADQLNVSVTNAKYFIHLMFQSTFTNSRKRINVNLMNNIFLFIKATNNGVSLS